MNAGFLSFIVISMVLVLLLTGWKDMLIGKRSADGRRPEIPVVIFVMVWFSGLFIQMELHRTIAINGAYLLIFFIACFGLGLSGSIYNALQIGTTSMLIGAADVFYKQLLRIEPELTIHSSIVDVSLLLALMITGLSKGLLAQFASITFGLTIGFALFAMITEVQPPFMLGNLRFFDQWWFVFLLSRVMSFLVIQMKNMWNTVRR